MEHESRSTIIPMFVQMAGKSSLQYARDRSASEVEFTTCSIFFVVSSCSKHEVCHVKAQNIWNLQTWLCLHSTPEVCMVSGSKRSQKHPGQFQVCRCNTGRESHSTTDIMQTEASVVAVIDGFEVLLDVTFRWVWSKNLIKECKKHLSLLSLLSLITAWQTWSCQVTVDGREGHFDMGATVDKTRPLFFSVGCVTEDVDPLSENGSLNFFHLTFLHILLLFLAF